VLNGEENVDTVSYATSSAGVEVSLNPADGAGEGGDAQGDRLFNVENLSVPPSETPSPARSGPTS
jgi:hypothetical protein